VLVLAGRRFYEQNMLHHAAALTYHSMLSLFQGLVLAVALLGLLGSEETLGELARFLTDRGADRQLVESLIAAARNAVEAKDTSAVALGLALLVAIVFASSAFVTASVALNVVVEVKDERPFLRRRLQAMAATLVVILLGVGAMIAVFLGGGLAEDLFGLIGLGGTAADVWAVVRFPAAALLAMTAFAWIYYAAPTVPTAHWRWISLGAALAVVVWLAASLGLFAFTANFGNYNATYGAFATAILLVVWLWVTNLALLFGAEVNAAGRYADGSDAPLSKTGDSPDAAQQEAAKRSAA
jgi:membrane protein